MIPYDAKTATEHRQRWACAVSRVFDFRGIVGEVPEDVDRPGKNPEHVFDFHDGLRLIVSTDLHDWGQHLHVSASAREGSVVYEKIKRGKLSLNDFIGLVKDRVRFIGGEDISLCYITEGKGVPHFYNPPLPANIQSDIDAKRIIP